MSFPIPIANKLFVSLFLWLFTFAINLWHQKFVTADVTAVFVINMVFRDKDKILIRSLYLKGHTAKRLTDEFSEKCWTKHGVNKLLKRCGTQAQFTGCQKFEFSISQGRVATCLR